MLPSLFEEADEMTQRVEGKLADVLKEAESATSDAPADAKAKRDAMMKKVMAGAAEAFLPGALDIFSSVRMKCPFASTLSVNSTHTYSKFAICHTALAMNPLTRHACACGSFAA